MSEPRSIRQQIVDRIVAAACWLLLVNAAIVIEIVLTYQLGPWLISVMGERLIPPVQDQARLLIEPISREQMGEVDKRLDRSEKMLSRLEKLFPRRAGDGPRTLIEAIEGLPDE